MSIILIRWYVYRPCEKSCKIFLMKYIFNEDWSYKTRKYTMWLILQRQKSIHRPCEKSCKIFLMKYIFNEDWSYKTRKYTIWLILQRQKFIHRPCEKSCKIFWCRWNIFLMKIDHTKQGNIQCGLYCKDKSLYIDLAKKAARFFWWNIFLMKIDHTKQGNIQCGLYCKDKSLYIDLAKKAVRFFDEIYF